MKAELPRSNIPGSLNSMLPSIKMVFASRSILVTRSLMTVRYPCCTTTSPSIVIKFWVSCCNPVFARNKVSATAGSAVESARSAAGSMKAPQQFSGTFSSCFVVIDTLGIQSSGCVVNGTLISPPVVSGSLDRISWAGSCWEESGTVSRSPVSSWEITCGDSGSISSAVRGNSALLLS